MAVGRWPSLLHGQRRTANCEPDMIRRMFIAYEVLLYLVFLLVLPFFLITGLLRGKYLSNFPQRIGFYRTPAAAHDLWIHAVSVGETLASRPVVDELLRRRPKTSIVLTTTTITGQTQALRLFPDATITYFPFDFTSSVTRFLDHHRPRVFAAMETEIWPNVTRLSSRSRYACSWVAYLAASSAFVQRISLVFVVSAFSRVATRCNPGAP